MHERKINKIFMLYIYTMYCICIYLYSYIYLLYLFFKPTQNFPKPNKELHKHKNCMMIVQIKDMIIIYMEKC